MNHISDSLEAEMEEWFGRGDGDPDAHTPPWEKENKPKPNVYKIQLPKPYYGDSDNDPASPEQGWA